MLTLDSFLAGQFFYFSLLLLRSLAFFSSRAMGGSWDVNSLWCLPRLLAQTSCKAALRRKATGVSFLAWWYGQSVPTAFLQVEKGAVGFLTASWLILPIARNLTALLLKRERKEGSRKQAHEVCKETQRSGSCQRWDRHSAETSPITKGNTWERTHNTCVSCNRSAHFAFSSFSCHWNSDPPPTAGTLVRSPEPLHSGGRDSCLPARKRKPHGKIRVRPETCPCYQPSLLAASAESHRL